MQHKRLWMFKWALGLFYLCVAFVLLGSLIAGISYMVNDISLIILYGSVIISVLLSSAAMIILIKESFVSASLIEEQLKKEMGY